MTVLTPQFKYVRPYYTQPEKLPTWVSEFQRVSGFDFTRLNFRVWRDGVYQVVRKRINSYLTYRALRGEIAIALPPHAAGNLYEIEISTPEEEAAVESYYTVYRFLRVRPGIVEADGKGRLRALLRFTEPLPPATLQTVTTFLQSQLRQDCSVMIRGNKDWIDLPGSRLLRILTTEKDGTLRNATLSEAIKEFTPRSLPALVKTLRSEGFIPRRESGGPIPSPDFTYGDGTRHQAQPRIAFHVLRNYGPDYERFYSECEQWDDGSSKDMNRSTARKDRTLRGVWRWAVDHFNSAPYLGFASPSGGNYSFGAKINLLPAHVAPAYPAYARSCARTRAYNPTLQHEETIEWWYNKEFSFSPYVEETLRAALHPVVQRLRVTSANNRGEFVENCLRMYRAVFEQEVWHRKLRKHRNYREAEFSFLNEAPVLSKENRRRMALALGIPQPTRIWKVLKATGLVRPLSDSQGHTYSYKGKWRWAEHYITPGSQLREYAEELFAAARASDRVYSLLSLEVLTLLGISSLTPRNTTIISLIGFPLSRPNLCVTRPQLYLPGGLKPKPPPDKLLIENGPLARKENRREFPTYKFTFPI